MKAVNLNPWNIHSLYDLQYFNCPCCKYKNSSKQEFVNHAYCFHPESNQHLRNITDGSITDVDFPPEFKIENKIKIENFDIVENHIFYSKIKNCGRILLAGV